MRAVAIVNGNARRARGRAAAKLERALPGGVHVSRSLDHARSLIRAEIARGVDLVVLGGGDGTIVMGLTLVAEACRGAGKPEPAIGVLRLGSGNAIADALGAGDDPEADLRALAAGGGAWRALPMLDVLGVRAPFVGVGVDAQLLEDHEAVGRVVDRVPGGRLLGGGARYALAIALRSMPRFALGERALATVTNAGSPAIEMASGGATGRELPRGHVLWRGACTLVAGSTIRYFGFGLEMFAFARTRDDRFQLRCGDAGFGEIVRSTPAAFRGDYFSDSVRDFLCDRVTIELDREVAVEAGGELLGRHRQIELAIAKPVTFASATKNRV
nr:diacylglycerol kinase family protein [Kofleriaceae bacterium]